MKKLLLLSVLVFAVVAMPTAQAASLTITSFKCNDKASLAIENGGNINCVVRIQNNDGASSATVGTISLLVSGGWAEQSTYSMSISTTIGASQSTEKTFEGVKPVTTGNNLGFSSVEIDGTPHTEEVTSVAINSMAIKTLSLTTSTSSTATNNEFDAYSSVRVGGNFNSMSLTLSTSGCSLKSGETAAKSLGSMSNNAEESASWKVVQGSGSTCSLTVTASGTTDTVTLSRTGTASVSNPGSSSNGTSAAAAGGGGGGGANATNVTANVTAAAVAAAAAEAAAAVTEKEAAAPAAAAGPLGAFFGPGADYTAYLIVLVIIIVVVIAVVFLKKRR